MDYLIVASSNLVLPLAGSSTQLAPFLFLTKSMALQPPSPLVRVLAHLKSGYFYSSSEKDIESVIYIYVRVKEKESKSETMGNG